MVDLVPGHSENMIPVKGHSDLQSPFHSQGREMKICRGEDTRLSGLFRGKPATTEHNSLSLSSPCSMPPFLFPFSFVFSASEYPLVLLWFFASVILYVMVLATLEVEWIDSLLAYLFLSFFFNSKTV